jgi:flagellar basal-body rod protein FlgC
MISGINSSLAAFFTFGAQLSNTAGNVANVNTDGYKKTVGTIVEDSAGLPALALSTSDSPGALIQKDGVMTETSNVDLNEELPQMIVTRTGYEANIKALQVQDDLLKSTLNILA